MATTYVPHIACDCQPGSDLDQVAAEIARAASDSSGVQVSVEALDEPHQESVPPRPVAGQASRHKLRLWQCGFDARSGLKGPSPTCDVLENLRRALLTESSGVQALQLSEAECRAAAELVRAASDSSGVQVSVGALDEPLLQDN